jgi:putative ABC transport system permease protein
MQLIDACPHLLEVLRTLFYGPMIPFDLEPVVAIIKRQVMFRNYVTITIRNIFKNKIYSFINVAGLSIGIACSLLILLWVFDELTFDRFLPKSDRLYQVWVNAEFDNKVNSWTSLPLPVYEAMKTANTNIVNSTVADWGEDHLLTVGDDRIMKRSHFVGSEFLEMFEYPLVKGTPDRVLDQPNSIVITESTAKALFGDEDPIEKVIRLDDRGDLKVTGVLKDVPKNSTFQFDCLVPWAMNVEMNSWVKESKENWGNYSFQVFVELNNPSTEVAAEKAVAKMLTEHGEDEIKNNLFLHPITRWRLYSKFQEGKEAGGMIEYVQMFSLLAIFILVIACINFMNLATARSERRAKEVGIRKSIGSRRRELVFQFLGESLFITSIAFVIAVLLAQVLLPLYNALVEKELAIPYSNPYFWMLSGALIILTGLIAGSYPAFYLSSFNPVKVLKGKIQTGKRGSVPRMALVILQFGFSILLIIGTVVIYQQIMHVKSRDLGYAQENLITVESNDEIKKNYTAIKAALLQSGAVEAVTRSNSPITDVYSNNFLGWPGKPEEQRVLFVTLSTDYDYTTTMGIKIFEGRDFSEDFKTDTAAILVNKAGMDIMNLKDPLGTELSLWGGKRKLIGIFDNVLMGDPHQPIKPAFMVFNPDWVSAVTVRLKKTDDLKASLAIVEDVFKKYNPAYPFDFAFADVEFAKKFKTINMTSSLASLFATLAIVITGLGLFGLAAFTAEQRTKEMGVRKVLGASVSSLVGLMSRDFSWLVIIAFGISAPIAWWFLDRLFLAQYQYRIDIAWWVFPLTGLIALAFALSIVSTQAFRAARANPVNSLRNE